MGHTASRGPKPSRSTAEAEAARPKPDCGAVGKAGKMWGKPGENVEKPGKHLESIEKCRENVEKQWKNLGTSRKMM